MYEDLAKAQEYFEECEALSPAPYTLLQTALFCFSLQRDFAKTIAKADEIKARWDVTHDANYGSALALKGESPRIRSTEYVERAKSLLGDR
jgi:hypothetical protein